MKKTFQLTKLVSALALLSLATGAGAAGLDRSTQPSADFSADGTLAYISAIHISPTTEGKDTSDRKVEGVAQSYEGYGYGVKTDINDSVSVGVFYDQPFGAEVEYEGNNALVDSTDANNPIPTTVEVSSHNFTGLLGLNLGTNNNFKLYGGPVMESIEGNLKLHGDRSVIKVLDGYSMQIQKARDYGYMVGAAYVKPEIALKAAITYRSEIDHDVSFVESMPLVGGYGLPTEAVNSGTITKPESINLDFQTGLNKTTLLTAKARWVPWSDFKIVAPLLNDNVIMLNKAAGKTIDEAPLLSYAKDQYYVDLSLAKRLTPKLAISGSVGWDSGAGNPVTPLGPVEGYYSVGLGAKYNFTPEWSFSLGGKYLMLGDAEGELSASKTKVGDFEDNNAYVVGMKLAYHSK